MQHIFRTHAERFAPIFPQDNSWKNSWKILCDKWNANQHLPKALCWKYVAWNEVRQINFAWKIKFAWHLKTEKQTLWTSFMLILSSENKMQHTTPVCFNGEFREYLRWHSCLIKSFVYFCVGLVLVHRHCKQAAETLCATYFPNLRWRLLSYFFRKKFIEIVTEKSCAIIDTRTELCR